MAVVIPVRAPGGVVAPPPPQLFLGNSFQGITTSIETSGGGNTFYQFTGTDAKYGTVLPPSPPLWGGTGGNSQVQQIWSAVLGNGYSADIVDSIITDNTVPAGVSSTVRSSVLTNPYSGSVFQQNSYLIEPGAGPQNTMLYVSHWIWLQADMSSRTGGANPFGEFVEFKTPGNTDVERFQIGYQMCGNPSNNWTGFGTTPVFIMLHDEAGSALPQQELVYLESVISPNSTQAGWGMGQTYQAPIPLGRWFRLEWAFNRKDSSGQGWMWAALTDPGSSDPALQAGKQFFALRGPFNWTDSNQTPPVVHTIGLNQSLSATINRVFIDNTSYTNLVRSPGSTYENRTTDYQVYTGWPPNATSHPSNYL